MGNRLATADIGRKFGGCANLGGAGSSPNTISPGLRPTFVPSGILIHPVVWPQYTIATDRTDNGLTAEGERTVLQTVAQNVLNRQVAAAWPLSPLGSLQCSPRPLAGGAQEPPYPFELCSLGLPFP